MKQITITNYAYKKMKEKALIWGFDKPSDFILAIMESQRELQKAYWDLIEGKTDLEEERKALHYPKWFEE